jgi:enoyl-CoA hydratase/carnithine racemase
VTVEYEVVDGVAWMTINRPEARNALSLAVRQGLFDGFARIADDGDAAVLVLTGAGDTAFCAGGDLKEMAETYGGLLSFGQTGDASGMSMLVEAARQVMGRADGRQVDADAALVHTYGGMMADHCTLLLGRRP